MTRDLRDGWVSYVENRPKESIDFYAPRKFLPPVNTYASIFHRLAKFKDVHIVPLQLLHRNSESVLKSFCEVKGVDYIPQILLRSTYHNKLWWGDMWSKEKNGFNEKFGSDRKWVPFFSSMDNLLIESLFCHMFKEFGHEVKSGPAKRFLVQLFFPFLVFIPTRYEIRVAKFNIISKRRPLYKNAVLIIIMYYGRIAAYSRAFYKYIIKRKITALHVLR
jgi:hypothetical protein